MSLDITNSTVGYANLGGDTNADTISVNLRPSRPRPFRPYVYTREYVVNFPSDWADAIRTEASLRGCTEQAYIAWCVAEKLREAYVEQQAAVEEEGVWQEGEAL